MWHAGTRKHPHTDTHIHTHTPRHPPPTHTHTLFGLPHTHARTRHSLCHGRCVVWRGRAPNLLFRLRQAVPPVQFLAQRTAATAAQDGRGWRPHLGRKFVLLPLYGGLEGLDVLCRRAAQVHRVCGWCGRTSRARFSVRDTQKRARPGRVGGPSSAPPDRMAIPAGGQPIAPRVVRT